MRTTRSVKLTVFLTAICVSLLVTFSAKGYLKNLRAKPVAQTPVGAPEFKQSIRIWVHNGDLRPVSITGWPGKALFTIENVAERDLSLQIEKVLPNRNQSIAAFSVPAAAKRITREMNLSTGDYVIYESSQPDVKAKMVIKPRNASD